MNSENSRPPSLKIAMMTQRCAAVVIFKRHARIKFARGLWTRAAPHNVGEIDRGRPSEFDRADPSGTRSSGSRRFTLVIQFSALLL